MKFIFLLALFASPFAHADYDRGLALSEARDLAVYLEALYAQSLQAPLNQTEIQAYRAHLLQFAQRYETYPIKIQREQIQLIREEVAEQLGPYPSLRDYDGPWHYLVPVSLIYKKKMGLPVGLIGGLAAAFTGYPVTSVVTAAGILMLPEILAAIDYTAHSISNIGKGGISTAEMDRLETARLPAAQLPKDHWSECTRALE